MDTAPLPHIGDGDDGARGYVSRPQQSAVTGLARGVEVAAGLFSAGLLLVGVALVALEFLAPVIAPGEGLEHASGPTWWRAGLQLAVGLLGEGVVALRCHWGRAARVWSAVAVLMMSIGTLWWCWWA